MSLGPLALARVIWWERRAGMALARVPEPSMVMAGAEQAAAFNRETERVSRPIYLLNALRLAPFLAPGAVAVDLGCGTGWELALMAAAFPRTRFVGVELSETMIAHCQHNIAGLDNAEVWQDDFTRLDRLASESVDVVWSSSSLHHLPTCADLRRLARTVGRVLKPGGQFYAFDLLRPSQPTTIRFLKTAFPRDSLVQQDYEHSLRAAFTLDEIGDAFDAAGTRLQRAATWPVPLFGAVATFPLTRPRRSGANPVLGQTYRSLSLAQKVDFWQLNLLLHPQSLPAPAVPDLTLAFSGEDVR